MKTNQRLSYAIMAVLSARATAAYAQSEAEEATAADNVIQEVVVTATHRSESLQNVPIAITALTSETLTQLNVQTFDDYIKYLPNVSSAGKGPGQNQVYMRGLSTTTTINQVSGGVGSFPNVAVYLDEQSVQLPGRNLDVYAADLERIEVLEGPQGTLYGAGAQAGAIRYITNKPKLDQTEGNVSASYSTTAHGDPSNSLEAVLNLPLIADKLAVRALIYNESRGGYIRNAPGTFARAGTDIGITTYFGGVVPPGSLPITNTNLIKDAYNPVVYKGLRLSGLYEFNENWSLLVQQSYQDMQADGVFGIDPTLDGLAVQQYNQSSNNDKFRNTALTLTGRLGALNAIYAGGYLDRNVDQITDYTAYARGVYAAYYQCRLQVRQGGVVVDPGACFSPSSVWHDIQKNTHQSHEVRLSTPDDWRLRAIGGLFYEDYEIEDSANFAYGRPEAGFTALIAPPAGSTRFDPSPRPPGTVFFNDITRGYKQKAAFLTVDYDLIPEVLAASAGTRFYSMDTFQLGSKNSGYGCRNLPVCDQGLNLDTVQVTNPDGSVATGLQRTFDGHSNRFNLSWKVADSTLVYATYSEGFRPGGFNRGQGVIGPNSPLFGLFTVPFFFEPDTLVNKEIGWKATWFDRRLQLNGAIYQEDWSDVQLTVFNPRLYGNLTFATNGPDYRVEGIAVDLTFKATQHLTLMSSGAWNDSEQTNNPTLPGANGQAIVLFPTGGPGSPLAQSPRFQGNIRARYEFDVNDYEAYLQVGAQHSGRSFASVDVLTLDLAGNPINYEQAAYTTYDASIGVRKDAWTLDLFAQNLTDEQAELYKNFGDWVLLTTINRPRTIGLRMSYGF